MPVEVITPVVARVTSTTVTNKVAAPGAAAAIASTADLEAGTWELDVTTFITGTTVANLELDNMQLMLAGVAKDRILNPVSGTTGATNRGQMKLRYEGAGVVSVRAVAAATAASIYSATIVATRVL